MDAVYLFYENGNIRLPFFDSKRKVSYPALQGEVVAYDKRFLRGFHTHLCRRDNLFQRFMLKQKDRAVLVKQALNGMPYVEVHAVSAEPVLVGNFFPVMQKWMK
jgi:hypothetical protein